MICVGYARRFEYQHAVSAGECLHAYAGVKGSESESESSPVCVVLMQHCYTEFTSTTHTVRNHQCRCGRALD